MEGRLLDRGSIHGVATSISYEEHSTIPYQVYKLSPAVTIVQLRVALTKTVKLIININMNDVVVSFPRYPSLNNTISNLSKNYTLVYSRARLPKSKSVTALKRLNSTSDKIFASKVSTFLGSPVTITRSWPRWYEMFDVELDEPKYMGPPDRNQFDLYYFSSKCKRMLFHSCVAKYQSMVV